MATTVKTKGDAAQTPVMRQYLGAKAQYPDAILLFRLGDFYEVFFEDAVTCARVLDLTLTARNKGSGDEIPMAGVPYHAASGYIQKLLEAGFQVALCEQMADPSKVKGIVPREVVRVVTPGIVFDDAGLSARENHYLVAVEREGHAIGIASLDLSTGELSACEAESPEAALAELVRIDPHEAVFGPGTQDLAASLRELRPRVAMRDKPALEEPDAVLEAILGKGEPRKATASSVARRAAARCVQVARDCEAGRPLPIARLAAYELEATLLLDESTQRHLELVRTLDGETKGALLSILDETRTAPGARLLRRRLLAPRRDLGEIHRRLSAVSLFVTQPRVRTEIRERLGDVADIERLAVKLALDRVSPRDLAALRRSLAALPEVARILDTCPGNAARDALGVAQGEAWVDTCADLHEALAKTLAEDPPARASDGGVIRTGFDAALDEARTLTTDGQRLIVDLELRLREESQIGSLKIKYTRVFGWYLEVTRSNLEKAPKAWRRKQTIATGERFTCDALDTLADKLAHAEERASVREAKLFIELVTSLAKHAERLKRVAARLSEWDVESTLAEIAHRDDWSLPVVDESEVIAIEDGRHPVVEKLAAAGRFVPNDVTLDASGGAKHLWLVTGPNMAGKSTLMRQVALIVILAQMGSFVPARKARIGVVDRVLTRVGASDNLARGESTFMVEMKETSNVLRRASRRSLVVLDEIGRGTSTYDGLSIAWAVAEHLHDAIGCRAMFATHYHELTELCATHPGCANYSVSAREHEGEIIFFHKLLEGAASRSYGVACARLAGLPEPVLARAKIILGELESGSALPSGGHASLRAKSKAGRAQLDLFDASKGPAKHPALDMLRAIDVDRMTPLEALQLLSTLKKTALETP